MALAAFDFPVPYSPVIITGIRFLAKDWIALLEALVMLKKLLKKDSSALFLSQKNMPFFPETMGNPDWAMWKTQQSAFSCARTFPVME